MKLPITLIVVLLLSACHGMHKEEMGKDSAYPSHGMKSWRCSPGKKTRGCTHPGMHPYHDGMHRQDQQYRDGDIQTRAGKPPSRNPY